MSRLLPPRPREAAPYSASLPPSRNRPVPVVRSACPARPLPSRRLAGGLLALACALGAAAPAAAQVAPAAPAMPGLPTEARLREVLAAPLQAQGTQLTRWDIQLLPLAGRAELAPCARTEAFLPTGARPWGRVAVGVRCVEGAAWTLMVPAQVRAWGVAVVAQAPLAAGTTPAEPEVREQEVEFTREPGLPVRELGQLAGRTLVRAVPPGQVLRTDLLRTAQVVQIGDAVRLRIAGTGFAVTASGQALSAAAEGQPVRVRTELGKILTGTAREGRLVEVAL